VYHLLAYEAQTSIPFFHSYRRPKIRNEMNITKVRAFTPRLGALNDIGAGIISATSTSKIKNSTASKKNFNENPLRALLIGSNPHSNGVDISTAFCVLNKGLMILRLEQRPTR